MKPGRTAGFMRIDHNLIFCSLLRNVHIVIHHPLPVMILATRNDPAHITGFNSIVAVLFHELVGIVHSAFVICNRARNLMMHDEFHTFFFSIVLQFFHIEIRIWSHKIEHFFFPFTVPILPSNIPSFHQYTIKTMISSKFDIAFCIFSCCAMPAIWSKIFPIRSL